MAKTYGPLSRCLLLQLVWVCGPCPTSLYCPTGSPIRILSVSAPKIKRTLFLPSGLSRCTPVTLFKLYNVLILAHVVAWCHVPYREFKFSDTIHHWQPLPVARLVLIRSSFNLTLLHLVGVIQKSGVHPSPLTNLVIASLLRWKCLIIFLIYVQILNLGYHWQ